MSNYTAPFEDNCTSEYMKYSGIYDRCRKSLAEMDINTDIAESVACLARMAKEQMEKAAATMPF